MSESEPLFALLELMLRTFTNNVPKMKAGGHPEEMFLDLTEDERDEIECSICYQILRDVRQCENKHKFCYSCIFVWSTSGNPVNHSRCPVCRVEGLYVRNNRLDETINSKRVKCSMKSCKWTGALTNLPSHQHTTYTDERSTQSTDNIRPTELPSVVTASTPVTSRPHSESRSVSRLSAIQANNQTTVTANPESQTRRLPLAPTNTNTQNTARSSSTSRSINNPSTTRSTNNQRTNRSTNAQSTNRTRTRSRNRQNNSTSPQRRSNITATGLNSRLTSRARIQNTGAIENRSNTTTSENRPNNVTSSAVPTTSRTNHSTADENQNPVTEQTTTEAIHVPHPPSVPRTEGPARRRLPTLPNMLTTRNIEPLDTDNNNNLSSTSTVNTETESPRTFTITASVRRPGQPRSFGTIRDRLNESRQRLDMLMSVFSTELDRGRQDITSFQEERERRRQEQLAEVQNLGRRLTQVAQELRGLLSQRRQIRGQMDTLIQSASDDPD